MADVLCIVRGYLYKNVELLIGIIEQWDLRDYNLIWQMLVCGQGIVRCKCGIVIWKYVTVGRGRLYFDMTDVVCVVRGY